MHCPPPPRAHTLHPRALNPPPRAHTSPGRGAPRSAAIPPPPPLPFAIPRPPPVPPRPFFKKKTQILPDFLAPYRQKALPLPRKSNHTQNNNPTGKLLQPPRDRVLRVRRLPTGFRPLPTGVRRLPTGVRRLPTGVRPSEPRCPRRLPTFAAPRPLTAPRFPAPAPAQKPRPPRRPRLPEFQSQAPAARSAELPASTGAIPSIQFHN